MIGRGLIALAAAAVIVASGAFAGEARAAPKNFYGVTGSPSEAILHRASAGGVRTIRVLFPWATVEPTPGARNWESFDAIVGSTARAGLRVLPFLHGTPTWLSGSNPAAPPIYHPGARAAWQAFLADLTRRYGANGAFWALHPELPRFAIDHWQLWNEVNLSYYWGGQPNPRDYADLVRLSKPALREGDPGAKLVLAGLIPYKSAAGGTVPGDRYLASLMKLKGMRKLIDVVAVHPYGRSPKIVIKGLEDIRDVLVQAKAAREPIWATEFGWSTGGVGWSSSPFRATPEQQAGRVRATYGRMLKLRKVLKLRRAYYFSLTDFDQPGVEDDASTRMGLFDISGQPKPSWFAYARRAGGTP